MASRQKPSGPGPSTSSAPWPASPSTFTVPVFSSQQAVSSQDVDDQRFAELLKPIKDLTINWEVPLGRYLEEYIEELSDLGEIRLDSRGGHKVNFVEAALLLQGTASVYSKKVEFLWQNTLKMLDLLASRRALDEATGEGGGPGADGKGKRKKAQHDFNDFRQVACDMFKGVNMKPEAAEKGLREKKTAALNFISVTPRQLIEKEGWEKKAVRVNVYAKGGGSKDLLGHKEDFRVNAQFSMATATVGEELNEEGDLSQQSVSLCEESLSFMETSLLQPLPGDAPAAAGGEVGELRLLRPFPGNVSAAAAAGGEVETAAAGPSHSPAKSSPGTVARTASSQDPEAEDQPEPMDFGGDDFAAGGTDDDGFAIPFPVDPPAGSTGEPLAKVTEEAGTTDASEVRRSPRPRRNKLQESLDEPRAPLKGPWEPVKPDVPTAPPKPVKKGKTCRAPKAVAAELQNNKYKTTAAERRRKFKEKQGIPTDPNGVKVTVPIEQYLIRDTNHNRSSAMTKANILPEFREMAEEAEKEKKKRLAETERRKGRAEREEDEEEDDKAAGKDGGGGDDKDNNAADEDGWEEFQGGVEFDPGGPDDDAVPGGTANDADVMQAMLPEGQTGEAASSSGGGGERGDSYEELVMKRVTEYVQQSQEYIESTDLAKRVSRWHEGIRPRLDAVEKRGNFDIHGYGSHLLGSFPEGGGKTTVGFADAVQGKDREEVCRYFLSALMLANTYNIELGNGEAEAEATAAPDPPAEDPNQSATPSKLESKLRRKKPAGGPGKSTTTAGKSGRLAESLPMDRVEMTLLSTRRHHEEVMGYGAATAVNGVAAVVEEEPRRKKAVKKDVRGGKKGGKRKRSLEAVAEEEDGAP